MDQRTINAIIAHDDNKQGKGNWLWLDDRQVAAFVDWMTANQVHVTAMTARVWSIKSHVNDRPLEPLGQR